MAERLVQTRLAGYLERHRLLSPEQAGFRARRSCTEQVARLTQAVHDARARGAHAQLLASARSVARARDGNGALRYHPPPRPS